MYKNISLPVADHHILHNNTSETIFQVLVSIILYTWLLNIY